MRYESFFVVRETSEWEIFHFLLRWTWGMRMRNYLQKKSYVRLVSLLFNKQNTSLLDQQFLRNTSPDRSYCPEIETNANTRVTLAPLHISWSPREAYSICIYCQTYRIPHTVFPVLRSSLISFCIQKVCKREIGHGHYRISGYISNEPSMVNTLY